MSGADNMRENFFTYHKYLWFKITLGTALILIVPYIIYSARTSPNGGTVVGFIYGAIGLLAILLLMFYGIRKRSYRATYGTLQAWLSFHVYIGVLALFIIPMHAGFHFGIDIHTLAFVLMAFVVISGIVGACLYRNIPRQFNKFDKELPYAGEDSIDDEFNVIIGQIRDLCEGKSPEFNQMCEAEIRHGLPTKHAGWGLIWRRQIASPALAMPEEFAAYLDRLPEAEHTDSDRFVVFATQKRELEYRFVSQMRLRNRLEAWLHFHLPVSIAMMIAIVIHIVLVFYHGYRVF